MSPNFVIKENTWFLWTEVYINSCQVFNQGNHLRLPKTHSSRYPAYKFWLIIPGFGIRIAYFNDQLCLENPGHEHYLFSCRRLNEKHANNKNTTYENVKDSGNY